MKTGTTIKNILILLVVGLGIFLVVRNYESTPIVSEQQIKEVSVSEPTPQEDFLTRLELRTDLESQGYSYGLGTSYRGWMSIEGYFKDKDNPTQAVLSLSEVGVADKDNTNNLQWRVYDTLKIDASSYCKDAYCDEKDSLWVTECRFGKSEHIIAVVDKEGPAVFAAWIVDPDTRKFVPFTDLEKVECYDHFGEQD